jgi:hypothetical protein
MVRSMRFASIILAFLAVLVLSANAWAQPGRGMGMGMFGGGQAQSISAQYGRLLGMPSVQKELELVDDQKAKITEANEKMMSSMREAFSGMEPPSPDMTPEERQKSMEEMQKKMQPIQDELKKTLESVLLPNQLKRLKEIAVQVAGAQALNDKQIQEELKLTSDQLAKIKTINEDMSKKMRELFESGDFQSMREKMPEIRQDTEKKLLGVLTDAQKASLEKMKGQKLEIPESEMRGPGRRGGMGGGRNGGETVP